MSLNLAPKVLRGVIDLLRIHRCVALAGEALSFGNRIAYPVSRGVSGEVVVGGHSAKTKVMHHGDAKDVSASWVGECMIDCAIEVRDLQIAGIVEY